MTPPHRIATPKAFQDNTIASTMIYTKTAIAYAAILLALGVSRPEAFVPSSGAAASFAATCSSSPAARCRSRRAGCRSRPSMSASDEHDILLRVAKGEKADRAPVWLMRQVNMGMSPAVLKECTLMSSS